MNPTPPAPVIAGLGLSEAGLGQVLGVCCVCVCFFFFFWGGGGGGVLVCGFRDSWFSIMFIVSF